MHGRRPGRGFGPTVPNGLVDGSMLLDRGLGLVTQRVTHTDRAGLSLQPARATHGADEERVVRGRRGPGVKVVVRLVEHLHLPVDEAVAAGLHGDFDGPQFGGRGTVAARLPAAISWTLRNSNSEKM
jgi:hypothetical protein